MARTLSRKSQAVFNDKKKEEEFFNKMKVSN